MSNKFSRTEMIDGEPVVTLFATGFNLMKRQIEMLGELAVNNRGCPEIYEPATAARESLQMLGNRVNLPKVRSSKSTTPDAAENAPPMETANA